MIEKVRKEKLNEEIIRLTHLKIAGQYRRQIIIIDYSAFPIKSVRRFGRRIRQVEKVDSDQGFRFHNFFWVEVIYQT